MNITDVQKSTPLMNAASATFPSAQSVNLIIQAGANVNLIDKEGSHGFNLRSSRR